MKRSVKISNRVIGATRAPFAAIGFGMAIWAPLVPYAQSRLNVDSGTLGLLLLCLGMGSLAVMPVAGALAARFGSRVVILAASLAVAGVLPLLASVSGVVAMAIALLLFGAAVGAADVAINVQAVIVEQMQRRAMMSGFHAFYSLGGIVGSGSVSLALWLGVTPREAASGAAGLLTLGLLPFGRHMLSARMSSATGPRLMWPDRTVLVIGALCCVAFLTEGAMLDWSGVFLTASRRVPTSLAGAGFAVFSVTMTVARLAGDAMMRIGARNVIAGGALVAALGLLCVVGVDATAAALIGFALVGLGLANLVPALYSALGRQTAVSATASISAASTMGYAGILIGPVLIGIIAQIATLSIAFLVLGLALCVVAMSAKIVFHSDK